MDEELTKALTMVLKSQENINKTLENIINLFKSFTTDELDMYDPNLKDG
jgi:hypothetical protein